MMTEVEARESGLCLWCAENGHQCHPHSSNGPEVTCPGELCATCDYVAEDDESEDVD